MAKQARHPSQSSQSAGKVHTAKVTGLWADLARYAVIRNLMVGLIITLAIGAVMYLVYARAIPRPAVTASAPPPAAGEVPPAQAVSTQAAEPAVKPPPPPPPDTRFELIEPPPEMMAKAMPPLVATYEDGVYAYHNCLGNVAVVESTKLFTHSIVTMGEGQYHHIYEFKLGCGHTVTTTPDPYRNVIYKFPEQVAAEYQAQMCASCESLKQKLQQKHVGKQNAR